MAENQKYVLFKSLSTPHLCSTINVCVLAFRQTQTKCDKTLEFELSCQSNLNTFKWTNSEISRRLDSQISNSHRFDLLQLNFKKGKFTSNQECGQGLPEMAKWVSIAQNHYPKGAKYKKHVRHLQPFAGSLVLTFCSRWATNITNVYKCCCWEIMVQENGLQNLRPCRCSVIPIHHTCRWPQNRRKSQL